MTASPLTEILALNRFDASRTDGFPEELAERVQRRSATFGASSVLFYEQPIEMVRAEGAYMYGADGRRYLDVYNNVPSVGHCHPRVVEAISRQAAAINIHTRYLTRIVETYSERLLATFPAPLSNLVMTCTGSESNDLAMRIARTGSGAEGFIVTEAAYHGNTALVTEISPSALKTRKPAAFVRTVPAPAGDDDPSTVGARFAADVEAAIADLNREGLGVAALVVDSIFSSDGIYADPAGFLRPAVEAVRRAGGVFIADEVQPGFGRTGSGLWGFSRHGVVPDIVTMGKPMGNGFPMGGVVTRPELLEKFCAETGYFNTFGGNPVAAAAGLAVLDVIADEGLTENAATVGFHLAEGLRALKDRHAAIGGVRGAGLFIGLDFIAPEGGGPDTQLATHVINEMKKNGILIGAAGKYGATLKIRPPLCFSKADADQVVETLSGILGNR
ncbi:aspartate aminotransferase family protein [Rhizobiaceae bacterium BDR2-2]|uniref:Aspartate aminotransferase family protein n=1 Tax=Ectorhizobium quercum TaxID=2965071 RepID=A0AAE3SX52_9HYPH|nr:aspartate aminotransferase family protein [Ectorhizobium quercum]MCX8998110.1 aspartate aminotransferase family protein [Ectorhizobium quercum]